MNLNQSIERGLAVLELLDTEPDGLGIREIARRTGLHPSNIQRLVATLVRSGYVEKDIETSAYRLSFKTYFLGQSIISHDRLTAAATAELHRISNDLGLSCYVAVRISDQAVYLQVAQGNALISVRVRPGERAPLHTTAMGKALLFDLTEPQLREIYPSDPLPQMTSRSLTRLSLLLEDLDRSRARGYSLVEEENAYGIVSVGAPVRDHRGQIVASLSAAFPLSSELKHSTELVPAAIVQGANIISTQIGCPPSMLAPISTKKGE